MLVAPLLLTIACAVLVPGPATGLASAQRASRESARRAVYALTHRTLIFRACWEREVAKLCLKLSEGTESPDHPATLEPDQEQMIIEALLGGPDNMEYFRDEFSKSLAVKAMFQMKLEKQLELTLDKYRNVTLGVQTDSRTAKPIVDILMSALD